MQPERSWKQNNLDECRKTFMNTLKFFTMDDIRSKLKEDVRNYLDHIRKRHLDNVDFTRNEAYSPHRELLRLKRDIRREITDRDLFLEINRALGEVLTEERDRDKNERKALQAQAKQEKSTARKRPAKKSTASKAAGSKRTKGAAAKRTAGKAKRGGKSSQAK